jgi:hypothetical protein
MHSPVKIHKRMRNARVARQALLQAYRANKTKSGANIVKGALMRISRVAKPDSQRYRNLNMALLNASNVKKLKTQHGVSNNHAKKLRNAVLDKHLKDVLNFKL